MFCFIVDTVYISNHIVVTAYFDFWFIWLDVDGPGCTMLATAVEEEGPDREMLTSEFEADVVCSLNAAIKSSSDAIRSVRIAGGFGDWTPLPHLGDLPTSVQNSTSGVEFQPPYLSFAEVGVLLDSHFLLMQFLKYLQRDDLNVTIILIFILKTKIVR